jgi:hypothetical protein
MKERNPRFFANNARPSLIFSSDEPLDDTAYEVTNPTASAGGKPQKSLDGISGGGEVCVPRCQGSPHSWR